MQTDSVVSCSIALNPANEQLYEACDIVTGHIDMQVASATKVESVIVSILGQRVHTEVEAYAAGPYGSGFSTTKTVCKVFFNEQCSLLDEYGSGRSAGKDGYHFNTNTYQFPFAIRLAEDLPPTMPRSNAHQVPSVEDCVEVSWKLPSSTLPRTKRMDIQIVTRPSLPLSSEQLTCEKTNYSRLCVHGRLPHNHLSSGTPNISIPLELDVKNPKRSTITAVSITLLQHRLFDKQNSNEIITQQSLPTMANFRDIQLAKTFEILVPADPKLLVPTASSWESPTGWKISYTLEVKFHTSGLTKAMPLTFPVVIASKHQIH